MFLFFSILDNPSTLLLKNDFNNIRSEKVIVPMEILTSHRQDKNDEIEIIKKKTLRTFIQ